MTKQEWLIHILNGGKGTSNFTDECDAKYVEFKGDNFVNSRGYKTDISLHTENFAKYEKPKKMIKVAPYVYKCSDNDRYLQTGVYLKDDNAFLNLLVIPSPNIKFQRLTALEIEVEDYEQN